MIPDSMNPRQMAENILELQRQIKEAGSELPTPEAGDVGKILKVGSNGYELATEYSYTPPAYSSAEEVNTGQKWVDGSDIFRKVLTIPADASATSPTVKNADLSGIDKLIYIDSVIYFNDAETGENLMYVYPGNCYYGSTNRNSTIYDKTNETFIQTVHFTGVTYGGSNIIAYYTKPATTPELSQLTRKKTSKKGE